MPSDPTIPQPVRIYYRNHRFESAWRTITPVQIWWGVTEWHSEPQWMLRAHDHGKKADRDFAVDGIMGWTDAEYENGKLVGSGEDD